MSDRLKKIRSASFERALSVRRDTLNDENRTVDVVFATETPVPNWHGEIGDFDEVLDCKEGSGDLRRLNSGGQFLKEHDERLVVGVIENARFENGEGIATMRYAKNALGDEEFALMRDGIRKNFSVRYRVNLLRQEQVSQEDGNVFRAVSWEALEISVVSVPADPKCQALRSRGDNENNHETTIEMKITDSVRKLLEADKGGGGGGAAVVEISAEERKKIQDETRSLILKENKEIDETVEAFRKAGHDFEELGSKARSEGWPVDKFRNEAIRSLNEKSSSTIIVPAGDIRPPNRKRSLEDAIRADKQERPTTGRKRSAIITLEEYDSVRATTTTSTITNFNGIVQLPAPIEIGLQRLTVADLLAQGTTNLNAIPYMQEDSFTPSATTTAEGSAKPEQSFDLSQTSAPVKKIAVWTKMSDELMEDVPSVVGYINGRLIYAVQIEEEDQILNGNGVGANLTGILQTGTIQTQALGGDTKPDAFHKAITKVRSVGFFEPDGIVIHPNDWQELRLLKDGNQQYFGGGPFTGAYGNSAQAPLSLWGLPVVVTTSITEGTALVGAFKLGAMLWRRKGISVEMTNTDQDDFIKNLVTVRVEERAALAVWRPKAFCQVTGI